MHRAATFLSRLVVIATLAVDLAVMLQPTPVTDNPYLSALYLTALGSPSLAATGCENKICFIAPDGNQSKCVDNLQTSCTIESVHGRGHGRICVTNTCF